jgi:hypothetical protein
LRDGIAQLALRSLGDEGLDDVDDRVLLTARQTSGRIVGRR